MFRVRTIGWLLAFSAAAAFSDNARALPAYAEQTQQPCQACHVGGFGPQLTPFGREFKLNGYAMRAGDAFNVPLSAMAMASFVHTEKDQSPPPHYAPNDNFTIDQLNIFVAGGVGDHFGGFAQFTYDGVGRSFAWDNLDLRAVDRVTLFGSDVLLGLSFNNNPTVQEVWNTLPAWGYPYTDSDLVPAPSAGTVISGALSQSVLGMTAYAWWDSHIYTEAGLYWTPGRGFLRTLGVDPDEGGGVVDGAAPYLRAAYQQDLGNQVWEVGTFALIPDLHPPGLSGTDHYVDYGIDASYQYLGDMSNIYSVNAVFTHEDQNLDASFANSLVENKHNTLNDFRLDFSYYWHNMLGVTVQPFETWGSKDSGLYGGNRTFSPESNGVKFQGDYTLFPNGDSPLGQRFNMRVGLQYTVYTKFDGATSNFDTLGSNASDNNTLRIFIWTAY